MADPRQQTPSGRPVDKEILPNEHPGKSKTVALAALSVICVAGFLVIFFLR